MGRQAPPDPRKASEFGVEKYVPKRHQADASKTCRALPCGRTATWEIGCDRAGTTIRAYVCDAHRQEILTHPGSTNYQERRLR